MSLIRCKANKETENAAAVPAAQEPHNRVEKASSFARQARLCLSQAEGRRLCRWMLLARLPQLLHEAQNKPKVLGQKTRRQHGSR